MGAITKVILWRHVTLLGALGGPVLASASYRSAVDAGSRFVTNARAGEPPQPDPSLGTDPVQGTVAEPADLLRDGELPANVGSPPTRRVLEDLAGRWAPVPGPEVPIDRQTSRQALTRGYAGSFADSRLDAGVRETRTRPEPDACLEPSPRAHEILRRQQALLPIVEPPSRYLVHSRPDGLPRNAVAPDPHLVHARIPPAQAA